MKAGLISLGCSKNRVDSELLLGELRARGFEITPKAEDAEILIVNTCGFIEPAKQESIDTTLEMAAYKKNGSCKLLVMCGCLSQRYPRELAEEMPEVDLFWGVKEQDKLAARIAALAGMNGNVCNKAVRLLTTPSYSAYLRIADGCDNRCAYCAIPLIRGNRKSVAMETLLAEATELAEKGVEELTLIAQDTSAYGEELYGKPMLAKLLQQIDKIEKLRWIRVLYTYPNTVNDELLDTIANSKKIAHYLDMPVQHIDDVMLKRMNRHGESAHIRNIIDKIKRKYPDFILRTTVMVGFPGETDEQFGRLLQFLREAKLDRVGAFMFSPEEGTTAAEMDNQIGEDIKKDRLDMLMREQQLISLRQNEKRIGREYQVLVERVEGKRAFGRSYAEAPEVDGCIEFSRSGKDLRPGSFTKVRIKSAKTYDLIGEEL